MTDLTRILILALASAAPSLLFRADTITLTDGTTAHGSLQGREADFVILEIHRNQTTGYQRFSPRQIRHIHFTETFHEDDQAILKLADYLGLLRKEDEDKLVNHLDRYLSSDAPLAALSYAKLWKSKLAQSENIERIDRLLITSALACQLVDEAAIHARSYIQNHPSPRKQSVARLALAQAYLKRGLTEAALWQASFPLAHGADNPIDLQRCRELAAQCYRKLGYPAVAERLVFEDENETESEATRTIVFTPPSLVETSLDFSQLLKSQPKP
ncbi:hypothetical protein [Pelagicoccus sp. SDUM812003]|uniref:hypothetical protein n=1 Tax=Pelagicoccus sp. SDUM812003 TaxID=3041267 RepID=UPI00280F7CF6|nr:hypothetical protein [Pelagicoccus sp. SDUM812003]MDQ8204128.1 hypothetical protein [Pelagicoccus sp. SDUM812003]